MTNKDFILKLLEALINIKAITKYGVITVGITLSFFLLVFVVSCLTVIAPLYLIFDFVKFFFPSKKQANDEAEKKPEKKKDFVQTIKEFYAKYKANDKSNQKVTE